MNGIRIYMGSSCRSIHIHLHGSSDIFYSARACVLYNSWIQNPKRKGKRKLCTVDDRARVVIVVVVAVRAFGIVSILYIPEKQKQFFFFKKKLAIDRGGAYSTHTGIRAPSGRSENDRAGRATTAVCRALNNLEGIGRRDDDRRPHCASK